MDSKALGKIFETLSKKYILTGEISPNSTFDEIIDDIVGYYEGIINPMPTNIYWLDINMKVAGCNQNVLDTFHFKSLAEIKGLSYEGLAEVAHWPEQARASFRQDSLEVMRTGKPKLNIEEPPIPTPDGRLMYFLSSRVPLFDKQGTVVGIVGISIDISDRKRAEQELKTAKEKAEAASYTKSEFIANMNHDIRTPLASVIGMAEIIIEESQEYNIKEYAQDIIKAGGRLLEFVNNILEVMQTDMADIQQHPVDLRQISQALEELLKPSFTRKNLDFCFNCDETIPTILGGSPSVIYRIVLNLLGNAVKFTDKGSISLSIEHLKTEGEQVFVAISVVDSGIGIPEEMQQIIFEPFAKLSASYQGVYKGNGLGLYTVKQLVEKLHGTVELHSSPGKGSTFIIKLPLLSGARFAAMANENLLENHKPKSLPAVSNFLNAPRLSQSLRHQHQVLVVEDDEIAAKVTMLRLKKLNCHVDLATSGEDAITKIKAKQYDLVYMDIGLPDKDGCQVTQEVRLWEKETKKQPVPIIALTAHINEAGREKCLATGINLVLKKPISRDAIKQHVEQYLRQNTDQISVSTDSRVLMEDEEPQEEFLSLFRNEIKDILPVIRQQYKANNWEELEFIIHKFNGSASYCAPQKMKIAISELENSLSAVQKRENLVSTCFDAFLSETDRFLEK